MGHLPKTQTQLYSDSQAKNSPYGNVLAPGDASGLNVNGYLMSRFGLNGFPTSKKGDKYYIAVDANNKLRSGIQVNGADKITWKEAATKDDLTPDFKNVGSGYGLVANHAAIGKLHILRLAGNVTSSFSNFDLALPDSCDGYFISEPGKTGNISYTIEINNKHLIVRPEKSVEVDNYFVHWLIYYGS